jgi:hypothetical protein
MEETHVENMDDVWCSACGAKEFEPCDCPTALEEAIAQGICPGCAAGTVGGPVSCVCAEATAFTHLVDEAPRCPRCGALDESETCVCQPDQEPDSLSTLGLTTTFSDATGEGGLS